MTNFNIVLDGYPLNINQDNFLAFIIIDEKKNIKNAINGI